MRFLGNAVVAAFAVAVVLVLWPVPTRLGARARTAANRVVGAGIASAYRAADWVAARRARRRAR